MNSSPFEPALEHMQKPLEQITALNDRARSLVDTDTAHACTLAEQAVSMATELRHQPAYYEAATTGLGYALLILIRCDFHQASYQLGLARARQALQYFEELDNKKGQADAWRLIGAALLMLESSSEALEAFQQSSVLFEQFGDRQDIAGSLLNLGICSRRLGFQDEALAHFLKGLSLFEEMNDKAGIAIALNNLGGICMDSGSYDQALEYMFRGLSIREEFDDPREAGSSLIAISTLYKEIGVYDSALEYALRVLAIMEEAHIPQGMGAAFLNIAESYMGLGNMEQAIHYAQQCLNSTRKTGDRFTEAAAWLCLGKILAQTKPDEALQAYYCSLALCREIHSVKGEVEALMTIGSLMATQYREQNSSGMINAFLPSPALSMDKITLDSALEHLHTALVLAGQLKDYPQLCAIHELLSFAYEQQGNAEAALKHYRQFHTVEKWLFNEKSDRKLKNLQVTYEVEHARKEAEIYRLNNIELVQANTEILQQQEVLVQQSQKIEYAYTELQEKNSILEQLHREKDEFLGIVAHDLKNPLSHILLAASMMRTYREKMLPDELDAKLEHIETTTQRMKEIVGRLLDINTIESREVHLNCLSVELVSQVRSVTHEYEEHAAKKNISLHIHADHERMYGVVDSEAFDTVMDNLLSNAIKYSPTGRNVWIRLYSGLMEGDAGGEAGRIRIEIQDEGKGIASEEVPKLFSKFGRLSTRPTGGEDSNGLGLFIVKKLVEEMGGQVWYESRDYGATFVVELPMA